MSRPDRSQPPDLRPIELGEVFENPVTRERAVILELPWHNAEGRAVAEMTALVGARVLGEHPALRESFSVLEGELTVVRDGQRTTLLAGKRVDISWGNGMTGSTSPTWTRSCASRSRPGSGSPT